jgi:RHS repeat-associated protein
VLSPAFTGKERDGESGLDWFQSRHLGGAQGRFSSADAMLAKKEWLADPQRWNRYAYVRNNPLRFIDPNGEDLIIYMFYGQDLTEQLKKYLQANLKQIQAAIAEKFRKAGVEKVEFGDSNSLTKKQLAEIRSTRPAGVAILGIVNRKNEGKSMGNALGGTDSEWAGSVVSLGNVVKGTWFTPLKDMDFFEKILMAVKLKKPGIAAQGLTPGQTISCLFLRQVKNWHCRERVAVRKKPR